VNTRTLSEIIRKIGEDMKSHNSINLRRMINDDYSNMLQWRLDSEVMRYYGNPNEIYTLERVIQKYENRINGNDLKVPLIIENNYESIGYIQYYLVEDQEKLKYELPISEAIFRIDLFIGSPDYRNKGMCSGAIELLKRQLNNKADRIILNVDKNNQGAVKCYKKCGFIEKKDINEKMILMEYKNMEDN
jgi:aminoglycoside 6'-N-acetyltransferase